MLSKIIEFSLKSKLSYYPFRHRYLWFWDLQPEQHQHWCRARYHQ